MQGNAGSLRTVLPFLVQTMSSGAPGVVSALGRKPSVGSSSRVATRVLIGTGRRSVATCLWKRLALSLRRDPRPSSESSLSENSCESLLSRLVRRFVVLCLEPKATKRRGERSHISKSRGRGVWKTCGEKPKPNQGPGICGKRPSPFLPIAPVRSACDWAIARGGSPHSSLLWSTPPIPISRGRRALPPHSLCITLPQHHKKN